MICFSEIAFNYHTIYKSIYKIRSTLLFTFFTLQLACIQHQSLLTAPCRIDKHDTQTNTA